MHVRACVRAAALAGVDEGQAEVQRQVRVHACGCACMHVRACVRAAALAGPPAHAHRPTAPPPPLCLACACTHARVLLEAKVKPTIGGGALSHRCHPCV